MTEFLVLDFETKDPYLGKEIDLGPGFPFAVNYPYANLFYPIGFSYCIYDHSSGTITRSQYDPLNTHGLIQLLEPDAPNLQKLKDLVAKYPNIIMHNAQYDLGCLLSLGINISPIVVYDTKIIAKLYDSTLFSYSLDPLAKRYLGDNKFKNRLVDVIQRHDLLKTAKGNSCNPNTKSYEKKAQDWAYQHMDILQDLDFRAMSDYANQDTQVTARLFKFLYKKVGDKLSRFYSNIQKICVKLRAKGNCISMGAVDLAIDTLEPVNNQLESYLLSKLGDINLHSNEQLPEALIKLGYELPLTEAGNPSINKDFIEENPNDELIQGIGKWRTIYMLLNQFSIKIRDMQKYSCPDVIGGARYGRVFPELNLLEARTGRFSSSHPNQQNVPKRNKEFAKLCRAMFVPDDRDKKWISLDWSNQEGRLQLHYAYLKGFKKTEWWLDQFLKNPKLDTHRIVAEMMYDTIFDGTKDWEDMYRRPAKTIYLGKSFCMGRAKTAKRLGLPTEWIQTAYGKRETSGEEATKLIEKYEEAFPYLTELQKHCTQLIKARGYIMTLNGRRCKRPPIIKGKEYDYKAISLLIQGSAADQMYKALTLADEEGIDLKTIVHDEFNIEGTEEDGLKMKKIMETCVDLKVPSVAEIKIGTSWGDLTKYEG